MSQNLLRNIPSVDHLLELPAAQEMIRNSSREFVRERLRQTLEQVRAEIRSSSDAFQETDIQSEIERRLREGFDRSRQPRLRRVINASGVVLHTNLGRAPLAEEAAAALVEIATHYSNLEYTVEQGKRGQRDVHCEELLRQLLGCEAAVVANNNAAAVMLALNTLAAGGEVIVSRGELIEIGAGFRIPEIMERSGALLREVGTTNKTHISDYERAINERTRLILRVHPSNYRIIGFTARPSLEQLVSLARERNIPVFEDLGSGCLVDLSPYGIKDEPVVSRSLALGASVVSFSGDKLLGGPQAGIIAGRQELVQRIRKNPLMRALRVDKLTYSALEATLQLYKQGVALQRIPILRALSASKDEIEVRALNLVNRIKAVGVADLELNVIDGQSMVGGGSAPESALQTSLIELSHNKLTAVDIESHLRSRPIPIIARIERDRVVIDLRTVILEEEEEIFRAVISL